jgi:hypothetical protein
MLSSFLLTVSLSEPKINEINKMCVKSGFRIIHSNVLTFVDCGFRKIQHFTDLYMTTKINHVAMEPQIARCVSHVHAFVTRPAFRHTVTTTYYKRQKKKTLSQKET